MIVRETTYDADTIADIKTATPRTVWFTFPRTSSSRETSCSPPLPTAMPKATATKYTTIARNELTYRTERIKVSPEVRRKYADVCKPRKVYKPDERPLVSRILSDEEYAEIRQEQEQHLADRDLLSRLLVKSRKLEDRLTTPPPPLIERLAPRTPAYEAPAPLPKQVKFRKHKIFKRIEEYKGLVDPTITRLKPFFAKLNERMEGPGTSVEKMAEDKRLEPIWNWYNRLAEIRDIITEEGHEFGVSAWRQLKGACKRIGKVSFENLDSRLDEICNELIAMDIQVP